MKEGITEAIESTAHVFAVGVQWHPEYMLDNPNLDEAAWLLGLPAVRSVEEAGLPLWWYRCALADCLA